MGLSELDKALITLENEVVAVDGAKMLANTLVFELDELNVVAAVVVKHAVVAADTDSPIGFSGNSVIEKKENNEKRKNDDHMPYSGTRKAKLQKEGFLFFFLFLCNFFNTISPNWKQS